jgi:hypothetical protein
LEEHNIEIIYNDLLDHILVFVQNVKDMEGSWRLHLQLFQALQETIYLFYLPELHNLLIPYLTDFLIKGNTTVKEEVCKLFGKIIQLQHHQPYREELVNYIKETLALGFNFNLRRSYIGFCNHVITLIPYKLFKKFFMEDLFLLQKDTIMNVRNDLAKSLAHLKPYFD